MRAPFVGSEYRRQLPEAPVATCPRASATASPTNGRLAQERHATPLTSRQSSVELYHHFTATLGEPTRGSIFPTPHSPKAAGQLTCSQTAHVTVPSTQTQAEVTVCSFCHCPTAATTTDRQLRQVGCNARRLSKELHAGCWADVCCGTCAVGCVLWDVCCVMCASRQTARLSHTP